MNAILVCLSSMILNWWASPICIDSLAYSVYMMESSGGINNGRRFEPAFLEKYGDKGLMPKLRRMYGDKAAASSYGPHQIMIVVAFENGFEVTPAELEDNDTNALIARYILLKYCDKYGHYFGALPKIYKRWNGSDKYAPKALPEYFRYYLSFGGNRE